MKLLATWLLHAIALLAVAYFMPAIHVHGLGTALIASAVIGLVNTLIRPILVILTLPITIVTLGLFILIINGALFYTVGQLLNGFHVDTIQAGVIGAIVYSVISWVLSAVFVRD